MANVSSPIRHPSIDVALEQLRAGVSALPLDERERALREGTERLMALDLREGLGEAAIRRMASRVVASVVHSGCDMVDGLRPAHSRHSLFKRSAHGGASRAEAWALLAPGRQAPADWSSCAQTLFEGAAKIGRCAYGSGPDYLGADHGRALLTLLEAVVASRAFKGSITASLDADAATQLRSSAATILQQLIAELASDGTRTGQKLLAEALRLAKRQAETETHPGLRESMVFGLYRLQQKLPESLREVTRALMRDVAPLSPPYGQWLADGKATFEFVVDGDAQTVDGQVSMLEAMGFTRLDESDGVVRLEKRIAHGKREEIVEARVRDGYSDFFGSAGRPDVDVIYFSGHADYGRSVRRAMREAPANSGAGQLIVLGTCFGKDNLQDVRARLPEAQVLGTFFSSQLRDDEHLLPILFDAVATRRSWASIREELGDPTSSNWVTPVDAMLRRRILDRDGDGRADALDRLFDVSLVSPGQSIDAGFEPQDPGPSPHRLQLITGVGVANWMNRGVGAYNEAIHLCNPESAVVCGGFFSGAPTDRPVRFLPRTDADGAKILVMEVNASYAHMPEEALRAVAAFELNGYLAAKDPSYPYSDRERIHLNGLMGVAFTLSHDLGQNDGLVWQALLRAYGFPVTLSLTEVQAALELNNADALDLLGGCAANIESLLADLTKNEPGIVRTLGREDAGQWQRGATGESLPERLHASSLSTVYLGTDPGDYYCEHIFFMAQQTARERGSSVARNGHGEPLVGFLHVPSDSLSGDPVAVYEQGDRHRATREVVCCAIRGYLDAAAGAGEQDPLRILLTGYDKFMWCANNPTGDFVAHRENVDAAMRAAYGDRLLTFPGELKEDGRGLLLEYKVLDDDGCTRVVQLLAKKMTVDDSTLDANAASSIQSTMLSFAPHAVLCMGQGVSRDYIAEFHADNGELSLEEKPRHDYAVSPTFNQPANYSLARAIAGMI